MANIKISELNELTKVDRTDIVPIVDVSANETKKVLVNNLIEKNVELLEISDTAPSECSVGDKYYNSTSKKIFTATDTDTWSETGETPLDGVFYILFDEQSSYAWNGSDLISVGGGKEDIVISDEEPTDPDVKIWIDTGEVQNLGSEITNSYSTSTVLGYSANYINGLQTYSTSEQRIGTWINGKPLYRKVVDIGNLPNTGTKDVALNISNLSQIIRMYGYADASGVTITLPYISTVDEYQVGLQASGGNMQVVTGFDRSSFSGYVIVEYIKTTD